ncbi:MAG TPA: hypothetical protein PK771_09560 [Spirochaetota bacterium]|nr:hypothetical protein [Spirochaetota bacterium]
MNSKKITFLFITLVSLSAFSYSEKEVVKRISEQLLINYDNKPYSELTEKIYFMAARKSYKRLLDLWVSSYYTGKPMKFEHDFIILNTISIIKANSSEEVALLFESKMDQLMDLSIKNFEMFKNAVMENPLPKDINEITCSYIDKCMLNLKYFEVQKDLYTKERELKQDIRRIMVSNELKNSLTFQIFFYELIMKLREKTIDRHLNSFMELLKKTKV